MTDGIGVLLCMYMYRQSVARICHYHNGPLMSDESTSCWDLSSGFMLTCNVAYQTGDFVGCGAS